MKWFPKWNEAHEFGARQGTPLVVNKPLSVQECYELWIEKKRPPFVRLRLQCDYQQNFDKDVLPFMLLLELNSVTGDTLENFRVYLVHDRGLAVKTARTIIDSSLKGRCFGTNQIVWSEIRLTVCHRMGRLECRNGKPALTASRSETRCLRTTAKIAPYWAYAEQPN